MKKIHNLKKKQLIFISVIIIIFILIKYNFNSTKNKDINFAANQYLTTGIFNKYKLYNIEHSYLIFSDSNNAIINVMGIENKTSSVTTCYKLKMSKDTKGLWHVKKVLPISDIEFLNENK